ncbi:hypothetical protein B0H13DRAFT_2579114 [Mycena leptocephala]|nr:hypothetical protein B0H13DRAFT_2579114 [Mycena leptocephala]
MAPPQALALPNYTVICRPAPALASYLSRPRFDPSFSLAGRERDTTLYDSSDDTHSRAHLVPIDVDVKGRGSDGRAVRVGHGDLDGGGAYILLLLCSPVIALTLALVILAIALAAAAAILKHGRLRLGAVDDTRRLWSRCATPNTSACLPSMDILLRKVGVRACANTSSLPASLLLIGLAFLDRDRQWLRAAAVRERARRRCGYCGGCGWSELPPTAHSASSKGPAYSTRPELRRMWTQIRAGTLDVPQHAHRIWIRHTALGAHAYSRAVGGGKDAGVTCIKYGRIARMRLTPREASGPSHFSLSSLQFLFLSLSTLMFSALHAPASTRTPPLPLYSIHPT